MNTAMDKLIQDVTTDLANSLVNQDFLSCNTKWSIDTTEGNMTIILGRETSRYLVTVKATIVPHILFIIGEASQGDVCVRSAVSTLEADSPSYHGYKCTYGASIKLDSASGYERGLHLTIGVVVSTHPIDHVELTVLMGTFSE